MADLKNDMILTESMGNLYTTVINAVDIIF